MYPNLYYVFERWFGVKWKALSFLNTFGLMVAAGFIVGAIVISSELKRKEKQGLLQPREESITVGQPASFIELFFNFLVGFIFGFKLFGLFLDKPDSMPAQDFIFSRDGNLLAGLALGIVLAGLKWYEKNKQKLKAPESRIVRIWPHDRVGDIVIIALVAGILGAKLFDNIENWDDFIQHPIERIFSPSGLAFYGGLIVASIAVAWYGHKRGIKLIHLADAIAPAMMIAYAIGRIGCQASGDGDWGIFNSAYITDATTAKVVPASPQVYQQQLQRYDTYFLNGDVLDSGSVVPTNVTDRKSNSLAEVPAKRFSAPSFIPTWMVAYNFPNNVNKDGIKIPGCDEEHDRVLPVPVFPTSFYETVICSLLFLVLWGLRKKITTAGIISGIYLILNGFERFYIEKMRVNIQYNVLGFSLSQAQIISVFVILFGVVMIAVLKRKPARGQ